MIGQRGSSASGPHSTTGGPVGVAAGLATEVGGFSPVEVGIIAVVTDSGGFTVVGNDWGGNFGVLEGMISVPDDWIG